MVEKGSTKPTGDGWLAGWSECSAVHAAAIFSLLKIVLKNSVFQNDFRHVENRLEKQRISRRFSTCRKSS
jgi:hypothetical protein